MEEEILELIRSNELLKNNIGFLKKVSINLDERLERDDATLVREQIGRTLPLLKELVRLKSRAELTYRRSKGGVATLTAKEIKGDKAKALLDSESALDRYARDLLEGYYDAIKSKLSASKTILTSLNEERKNEE